MNQKSKVNFFYIICIIILFLIPVRINAVSLTDLTNQLKSLQEKRQQLTNEILTNKKKAKEKKAEADRLLTEIKKIESSIVNTQNKIDELQGNIDTTQGDIDAKTKNIVEKENELAIQVNNQNSTIKTIYQNSTSSNTTIQLLSSNSISEAVDRTAYFSALENRIMENISYITATKDTLNAQKAELSKKKEELGSLKKQQEQYKYGLSQQKTAKNNLLKNVRIQQAEYEKLTEEAKKAYLDVNSELFKLQAAAQTKYKRDGNKKVGNINFSWPVTGPITAVFGEATPIQSFHTGLDVDCAIGDPLYAAADGDVTYASGNSRYGYGLYVTINHGSGIATLYGHASGFAVDTGDNVKKGDLVAYCGNTGFAVAFAGGDGSHLHFEVREDGIPVNPSIYLP